jgi:hypothetical protein
MGKTTGLPFQSDDKNFSPFSKNAHLEDSFMRKIAGLAGAVALGLSGQAFGYEAGGTVTFSWGGNGGGLADANSPFGATADTAGDIAWTANGTSALTVMTDGTYFSNQSGYNSRSYYNADFASTAECAAIVAGLGGTPTQTRKYGCRYTSYFLSPAFEAIPVADAAAATTGASATGLITVTDTTLTGTLTLNSTTDEPTGATTTFSPSGVRLSNSVGNGLTGYNLRSADGSPFGNYWQGTNAGATLTLNLTGTFQMGDWQITGGTVAFLDAGFACQQGGNGSTTDSAAGTLCTRSVVAGGQTSDGSHLSWGVDIDGAATGNSAFTEIEVRNAVGGSVIETLAGVLASVSIAGDGTVTTNSGEFRRALASAGSGCPTYIVWDGTRISCGTLTTGLLSISGTVTEIPVPAAAWLVAPALLAAGRYVRRRKAA